MIEREAQSELFGEITRRRRGPLQVPGKIDDTVRDPTGSLVRLNRFEQRADVVVYPGPCQFLLASMPDDTVQLVFTSPPYNIGKPYERRRRLQEYLDDQQSVIREVARVVRPGGSICWQVGNHVDSGEIVPLDIVLYPIFLDAGLKLRNRIVWHYEHGLHASRRLSGRYETILWFTKGDDYLFDVDPIRAPQKYPNKRYFKGPKTGQLSGHPAGKNPGDVWIIPNVKWNHVEKTTHPCQFPIELVERFVLATTRPGDWILDPYGGVGSTVVAAVLNGRKGAMAEVVPDYVVETTNRLDRAETGTLRTRPMGRPIYQPR